MQDQSPETIATTYFDALAGGDAAAAMALLDESVVWYQPGDNRFSGDHHGIDGVGSLLGQMMNTSRGTFRLGVAGSLMVNGALVAVPVRFSGSREGVAMDMTGIDLLTVRGGRIVEVHLFSEDGAAEDAFWGVA